MSYVAKLKYQPAACQEIRQYELYATEFSRRAADASDHSRVGRCETGPARSCNEDRIGRRERASLRLAFIIGDYYSEMTCPSRTCQTLPLEERDDAQGESAV
jgi:hypothetical protein